MTRHLLPALFFGLLALVACGPAGGQTLVVKVVDGDTLDVRMDGRVERVRLVGVDTPEVHWRIECFGREASERTARLAPPGTEVTLERDVSERDQYGRLLRYVYLPDGRMLDEVLVAEGYAQVVTYPPDVKYVDRFLAAQRLARAERRGLWTSCQALPAATPRAAPVLTPSAGAGCHPSYPGVCIPPPPPDLDCADIPYRRFQVLPPDPHRFDGDKDGVGCES